MAKIPTIESIWTSNEVFSALGVKGDVPWEATGVSIDSRTLSPGDLFIAIVGLRNDGHKFVGDAFDLKAAAAIVHNEFNLNASCLVKVNNTMEAMEILARCARKRCGGKIIGVTGSVGKTSTKEMLKLVLKDQGKVSASLGNLNNHWGLPLSLVRMPKSTKFGIFEMGMNAPGEIERLSSIVKPDVAVITTIENVHTEFFKSIDEIADAKSEIASGIVEGGVLVLNRDTKCFKRIKNAAKKKGVNDIKTFGVHNRSDYRLVDFNRTHQGGKVLANLRGRQVSFELGVFGRHWAKNSMAVLAAVGAVGGSEEKAANSLKFMKELEGRGKWDTFFISGGSFILIDESYNASPASMNAALEVLGNVPISNSGRRIAVLGEMLELGDKSSQFHEELIKPLQLYGVDVVFAVGNEMESLWNILPLNLRGEFSTNRKLLSPIIIESIRPGDVLMIKGSLASGVSKIVSEIKRSSKVLNKNKIEN